MSVRQRHGRHARWRAIWRSGLRRALHGGLGNALLVVASLALVGLAAEAWLRWTQPFVSLSTPKVFVPDVGFLLQPDTEFLATNHLDWWTKGRTNTLGFLDREPLAPEQRGSCHVAMLGDSFVHAREVPIEAKFHVRLEALAAVELPSLDITTSAYGYGNTGQIAQLAFWEQYARHSHPKLVVLAFGPNDFIDNFPLWDALYDGTDPAHLRHLSARRDEDGGFELRPPTAEFKLLEGAPAETTIQRVWQRIRLESALLTWFSASWRHRYRDDRGMDEGAVARAGVLARRPAYAPLLDGWRPVGFFASFEEEPGLAGSPFHKEALAHTAFALDQFKERTRRQGASLAILAVHRLAFGDGPLRQLRELAAERQIPLIDQADYIRRQGAALRDAEWRHDGHWNPQGHQWAAEALLEFLLGNPEVCA